MKGQSYYWKDGKQLNFFNNFLFLCLATVQFVDFVAVTVGLVQENPESIATETSLLAAVVALVLQ